MSTALRIQRVRALPSPFFHLDRNMYTLLELQAKTLGALKEIGDELNVLPADRRRRQSWIDAIAGVNPPLLQLLEDSPGVEVEQAQEPIIETVETFPGIEVDRAQDEIEKVAKTSPASEVEQTQEAPLESKFGRILYPRPAQGAIVQAPEPPGFYVEELTQEPLAESAPGATDCPFCDAAHALFVTKDHLERTVIRCLHCNYSRPKNYPGAIQTLAQESKSGRVFYPCPDPIAQVAKTPPGVKVDQRQEPIAQVAKSPSGVEADQEDELPKCAECFDDGFLELESGFIRLCQSCNEPNLSREKTQRAIAPASKNLPGSRSKTTAHQLLELFKSSAHIIKDSPGVKTEATVSESAIAPAAKNYIKEESDQNPILTGIPLSDRFVTRYTPPQPEIIHFQSDADGQLSLLDFEVESVNEPPDPDDFESLDAFREAIARWDWEHSDRFDHCSDILPRSVHSESNSVHCEPPNPDDFDSMFAFWAAYDAWDEASEDNSEPLEISLDSFSEWAPCPADWYEPVAWDGSSKVLEMSSARKSSSTSDFFIPTFGHWGDRPNRSDEPPDTGIFARLPKPKPPTFPPQVGQKLDASWTQVGHKLDTSWTQVSEASRNYPATIPKLFHRVVAGSSTQPARSPPGGDAMF